jgi:hypothetical protein
MVATMDDSPDAPPRKAQRRPRAPAATGQHRPRAAIAFCVAPSHSRKQPALPASAHARQRAVIAHVTRPPYTLAGSRGVQDRIGLTRAASDGVSFRP